MNSAMGHKARRLVSDLGRWICNPADKPDAEAYVCDAELLKLAGNNRLAPWLGRVVFDCAPGPFTNAFCAAYQQNLLASISKIHAAQSLSNQLKRSGIQSVMMRGVFAGHRYFGDMGLRLCEDVDVLIPPSARDQVLDLLLQAGYWLEDEGLPVCYFRRHSQHWPMQDSSRQLRLEVHWRLDYPFFLHCIDHEGIFARSEVVEHEGFTWYEAELYDDLLMIFTHLDKHARAAQMERLIRDQDIPWVVDQGLLYWWLDGALALERHATSLDPHILLARAKEQKLLEIVAFGLQSICNLWKGSHAGALLNALRGYSEFPVLSNQTERAYVRVPIYTVTGSGIDYGSFIFPARSYFQPLTGMCLWVALVGHAIRSMSQVVLAVLDVGVLKGFRWVRRLLRIESRTDVIRDMEGCAS